MSSASIRTAGDFVRAQTTHPQRAEVMVRLIEAYAAGARHPEVVATGRQFLEIFPNNPLAPRARKAMAEAYEKLDRPHEAGTQWAALASDDPVIVKRALDQFNRAENAQAGREGAEFALATLRRKPAEPWSASAAFKGMELAGRGERWETGAEIGRVLAPRSNDLRLWFRLGEFESRLGRHKEAVAAMEKSLTESNRDQWGAYMRELGSAEAPPATIEQKARELAKRLPDDEITRAATVQVCDAWTKAGKTDEALRFSEDVMTGGAYPRELAIKYVELCGDNHARAERFLLGRLGKHPGRDSIIREALAVDLYQLRMKDPAKSRKIAFDWLDESPAANGADRIAASLIDQSADEASVTADLRKITASAKKHAGLERYWDELWRWRSGDGKRKNLIEQAKRDFDKDDLVRMWVRAGKDGNEGAKGCEQLLGQSLTKEQKAWVMRRRADIFRHQLGDKARKQSHEFYKSYCKAYPDDWRAAEAWLEAAGHAGDEAKLEAARHMISLKPQPVQPDTRVRVVEVGDKDHRQKAAEWARKCAGLGDSPFQHASRIGRLLADADMKDQARAWWHQQYESDPSDPAATRMPAQ